MNRGFFNQRVASTESLTKTSALDVGLEGDSGFKALAVSLLDHVFLNARAHVDAFKIILETQARYFPEAKPPRGMLTVAEKIQRLTTQLKLGEYVLMLAYTLRQIAVDTIVAHPMRYRAVFTQPHQLLSPQMMRQPETWLSEISLAALSETLSLPIQVSEVRLGQELPLTHDYGAMHLNCLTNPQILLHLTDMQFLAEVEQVEKFQCIKSHTHLLHTPLHLEQDDPTREALMLLLKDEDEKKLKQYDLIVTKLMTMVRAGELNRNDLLTLYLNNLDTQQTLRLTTPILGLEYGNQVYFDHLLKSYRGAQIEKRPLSNETYFIQTLIQALARAVALGQINATHFEQSFEVSAQSLIKTPVPASKCRSQT